MTQQDKYSAWMRSSPAILSQMQAAYRRLEQALSRQPCLVQGSVNVVAPKSPGGNDTYTWTRKVRAKTVTVALSEAQADAFRKAIVANRRVEDALAPLRELSQVALLEGLPGVSRNPAHSPSKHGRKTIPKGA